MVLKAQRHAGLLRRLGTFAEAVDAPLESVLLRGSFDWGFDTLVRHELIEAAARSPSTGIHPHRRASQLDSYLNLVLGQVDVLLPLLRVRRQKGLMRGEAHDAHAM